MASTVYSGSIQNTNITHTNSSGKNERVLIYYLSANASGSDCTMAVGPSLTWQLTPGGVDQVWGINLGINVYTSNASSMTNHMSVASGDGTSTGVSLPLEFYLANGHIFRLTSSITGANIKYNFLVITED